MSDAKPPWKKKNPKKGAPKVKMTEAQIKEARARAEKAGRPYPNLIDNMAVKRKSAAAKKEAESKGFFPSDAMQDD